MIPVTNNTRETMDFVVAGKPKDGVPPTESVEPGETKSLDIPADDPVLQGRIIAGVVSVPAKIAEKAESAVAAPAEALKRR